MLGVYYLNSMFLMKAACCRNIKIVRNLMAKHCTHTHSSRSFSFSFSQYIDMCICVCVCVLNLFLYIFLNQFYSKIRKYTALKKP